MAWKPASPASTQRAQHQFLGEANLPADAQSSPRPCPCRSLPRDFTFSRVHNRHNDCYLSNPRFDEQYWTRQSTATSTGDIWGGLLGSGSSCYTCQVACDGTFPSLHASSLYDLCVAA